MRRTSLQMISLGLLLFGDWPLCAVSSRCMDDNELSQRLEKLQRRLENSSYLDAHNSSADLKDRSISPWTYKNDRNSSRHPHEILMAECLYRGCKINGMVTDDYNSVLVTAPLKVLYKNQCKEDPSKHMLSEHWLRVPVACVCVEPKY